VSLALLGSVRLDGTWPVLVALVSGALVGFIVSQLSVRWFDEAVRPLTDAARRMHEGDLTVRARVAREQDVGQLGAAFDQLAGSLSQTVGELRSERDLVSRILNGMQEGVLLLDNDGKVALMNPALREMLLLRADLVGQPLLEVVRHAELKELLDRARTTRTTCSGEVELGGLKPRRLLVRGTAFTQTRANTARAGGRVEAETAGGMLAVFFDVTDIRRLESLRRDFVGNVSHELRTPVTAILSAAETMEMALAKDPEGAKRFLGIIERNAARLQRLIEDLLDLSRIESRELRLRPERFGFDAFATHLLGMFRERADKRRIKLELESAKGVDVEADRRALEQVLTNLVDNAVKYCPEGSSVTLRAERIERSEGGATPGVRLRVEDDGSGIEEKHLGRLFERFYRVDAGRSREMGGTGLGLSIVKHLVEAMGGTIEVSSTVGKGTTFEVRIPDGGTRGREKSSSDDVGREAKGRAEDAA
jgi:two-component system phosphate regulon sensor histidine kinase PhoR